MVDALGFYFDPKGDYLSVALRSGTPHVSVVSSPDDINLRFDRESGVVLGFFCVGFAGLPAGRFVIPDRVVRPVPGGDLDFVGRQAVLVIRDRGTFTVEFPSFEADAVVEQVRPGVLAVRDARSGRLARVEVGSLADQPYGNLLVPFAVDLSGPRETAVTTGI